MKVVFIAGHEFTSPNNNGGKQVSREMYDLWCHTYGKENVYVVSFSNIHYETDILNIKYFKTHRNKIEQMFNACSFRNGYNRKTEKEIVRYVEELNPDIIYFDHPNTGLLLKKIRTNAKVYLFMHNIDHDYVLNKVIHESPLYFIPFLSFSANEKCIVNKADYVMNLNDRDKNRLLELYGRKSDYIIPVAYDDVFDIGKISTAVDKKELKLLFVGSYFGPNINGARWFVDKIIPKLKCVKLIIVGMNMEKLRAELSRENVEVIGSVDDLGEYYYDSDIVVIPILYGSGMKTKTAEAMMYGKKIIGTKEALEGYAYEDVDNILCANNEEEFVEYIEEEVENENRSRFYSDVRELFEKKYCKKALMENFKEFVSSNEDK